MTKNTLKTMLSAIALGLLTASSVAFAEDAPVYGSQLMKSVSRYGCSIMNRCSCEPRSKG